MNEEYLLGVYNEFGGQDSLKTDFKTWVSRIQNNNEYKKGIFTHFGGQSKLNTSFDEWNSRVFGVKKKVSPQQDTTSTSNVGELDTSTTEVGGSLESQTDNSFRSLINEPKVPLDFEPRAFFPKPTFDNINGVKPFIENPDFDFEQLSQQGGTEISPFGFNQAFIRNPDFNETIQDGTQIVLNSKFDRDKPVSEENPEFLQVRIPQPEDKFFRATDDELKKLEEFENLQQLSQEELSEIDNQIKEEESGDFGFFGNIKNAIVSTPTFGTTFNPFFSPQNLSKVSKREDLIAAKIKEKRVDFLSDLDDDEKDKIQSFVRTKNFLADQNRQKLEREINTLDEGLIQTRDSVATIDNRFNEIETEKQKLQDQATRGGDVNQLRTSFDNLISEQGKLIEQRNEIITNAEPALNERINKLNQLENSVTNIGTMEQELDLLKRNYGFLDNVVTRVGIGYANLAANFVFQFERSELNNKRQRLKFILSNGLQDDERYKDFVPPVYRIEGNEYNEEEFDKETEELQKRLLNSTIVGKEILDRQRENIRPSISVSDINSFGDVVDFTVDGLSDNVATVHQLAIPYVGQTSFVIGQQADAEINIRRKEKANREELASIKTQLQQEGISDEDRATLEKRKEFLEKKEPLSDGKVFLASTGMALSELAFSRLFGEVKRINVGKRVLKDATTQQLSGQVRRSVKDRFKDVLKGGGEVLKDAAEEGFLDEFLTNTTQNAINKFYLGDSEVGLFDNSLDAIGGGFSVGGVLSAAPRTAGAFLSHISNKNKRNQVFSNVKEITELQRYLDETPDLEQSAIDITQSKIQKLLNDNNQIIGETVDNFDNLDDDSKKRLLEVSNEIVSLDITLDKLNRKNNLTDAEKTLKTEVEGRLNTLNSEQDIIINQRVQLEVDGNSFLTNKEDFQKFIQDDANVQSIIDGSTNVEIVNNQELADALDTRIKEVTDGVTRDSKDNSFNPLESEGEAIGRLVENIDDTTSLEDVAKAHTDSYVNYLQEQGVTDDVLNSNFVQSFEERIVDALSRPDEFDFSQPRTQDNGSRVDNDGNSITETEFLQNQNKLETGFEGIDSIISEQQDTNTQEDTDVETNVDTQNNQNADVDLETFVNQIGESSSTVLEDTLGATVDDTRILFKEKNGNISIEQMQTARDSRGQGSARKALTKITEIADQTNKTLQLNVVPLDDTTTEEGLISLYESFGFKKDKDFDNEDGGLMFREPNTQTDFQFESSQPRIQGEQLSNLVIRLQRTGLAEGVTVLSENDFTAKLKEIGQDSNVVPNGFVSDGTVFLNRDKVKQDTPIHEFGHLWNSYVKQNNRDVYDTGINLIRDSEYHKAIQNNNQYDNLSEEQKLEEALAQAIGDKGVKILDESRKSKFTQWFRNLFTQIARGLGLRGLTGTQLSRLNLDRFTDLASAEILSGQNIDTQTQTTNQVDSSIDAIISEQKAIQEAKNKLLEKFRSRNTTVEEIKKDLIRYIRSSINSARVNEIQKTELNKLLNAVRKAKTKRSLQKSFNEVNDIVTVLDNRILKRRIDRILGSKLSKKESGRRKANTISEESRIILESVKNNIDTPKSSPNDARTSTQRRLDKLDELLGKRDELLELDTLTEAQDSEIESLSISIDLLNAITTKDINNENELLTGALEQLDFIQSTGRSQLREQKEAIQQEDNALIDSIEDDINPEGKTSLKSLKELENESRVAKNIVDIVRKQARRTFFTLFQGTVTGSLDSLSTLISRRGGENRDSSALVQFVNKLKRRETLKKTRIKFFSKKLTDSQKSIFGSITKAHKLLNKRVDIDLMRRPNLNPDENREPVTVPLTYSQMLNVWMNAKNDKLKAGLDANGFTPDVIKKIDEILPPKVKEYGDTLFNIYEELYIESNDVYKKMNFHSLGKPDFYAGKVYRDSKDTPESLREDTNALLGGVSSINSTGYSSQKERINNDNPIQAVDVNFLVNRQIQESSHYVAYAEVHRQYNKLLKDKKIQKAIRLNNPETADEIISILNYYKVKDLEQGGEKGTPLLDFFGRNTARSVLALKTKIGLTQTISFLNGAFDMPTGINPVNFVKHYNPVEIVQNMRFLLKNSDYLKNRYDVGGIENAMTGLSDLADQSSVGFGNSNLEASRKATARFYKRALDIAMLNVKFGDAIGVMGAVPAYSAWLDKFKKQGLSDAEATERAIAKFEGAVDRSQQSISTFGKSKLQKHPFWRYFMMFKTSPIQNLQNANFHRRELVRALRGREAKGTIGRNALAFINYQFAQPMLYTYIAGLMAGSLGAALGFGDEEPDDADKDLLRAAILGNADSVPIAGNIALAVVNEALDKQQNFASVINSPVIDNLDKMSNSWLKAFNAKTKQSRVNNLNKALKLTSGILTGLPNFAYDTVEDLESIYWNDEVDAEVKFLRGMGYSDFVIERARTQRISREKSEKAKERMRRRYEKSERDYDKSKKKTNPLFKEQKESKKR